MKCFAIELLNPELLNKNVEFIVSLYYFDRLQVFPKIESDQLAPLKLTFNESYHQKSPYLSENSFNFLL